MYALIVRNGNQEARFHETEGEGAWELRLSFSQIRSHRWLWGGRDICVAFFVSVP